MTLLIDIASYEHYQPIFVNMCNLSGRRVVVSINSTSERSCLWKPGLMILELRRVKVMFRRLVSKKLDGREWSSNRERFKPAHHRDIDAVKERTRFFASSSRHCLALAPHLLSVKMTHVR